MNKILIGCGVVIALLIAVFLFTSPSEEATNQNETETVSNLQDAHGLAVDRENPSKVYIATHSGLLVMNNDSELKRVSDAKDDYMGFSAHPTDPTVFYTSGHPSNGGNIGFQKSTDGGKTWQKIADGVDGPVDFHTMTVSQAEPNTVYGVFRGQLQRSNNEGKTWQLVDSTLTNPIVLATSPTSKNTVYAGTTNGLLISKNQGDTWTKLNLDGAVVALAANPKNDKQIAAYSESQGLVKSDDGGKTWDKLGDYAGDMALHLAYDPQNPSTIYLLNQSLDIYKTTDGGKVWEKAL